MSLVDEKSYCDSDGWETYSSCSSNESLESSDDECEIRKPSHVVEQLTKRINTICKTRGGVYSEYSCKSVSWNDSCRGTDESGLSCWGHNITDAYLKSKDGQLLYTVRSDNWNEKLGQVSADDVTFLSRRGLDGDLENVTLKTYLQEFKEYGKYAGRNAENLYNEKLDEKCSIRFQTTFIPLCGEKSLEFTPASYNYNTRPNGNPRNLILSCTSQGTSIQTDKAHVQRLFHHEPYHHPGKNTVEIERYWFEAEETKYRVGHDQADETEADKLDAQHRGKSTAQIIGTAAMGERFNALITVQVPLKQFFDDSKFNIYVQSPNGAKIKIPTKSSDTIANIIKKLEQVSGLRRSRLYSYEGCTVVHKPRGIVLIIRCFRHDKNRTSEKIIQVHQNSILKYDFPSVYEIIVKYIWEGTVFDNDIQPEDTIMYEPRMCGGGYFIPPTKELETLSIYPNGHTNHLLQEGDAYAARVSRGSKYDTIEADIGMPKRHDHDHITVTVVIYHTINYGVPTEADVIAAIDEMEKFYQSCATTGHLDDSKFDFVKKPLE